MQLSLALKSQVGEPFFDHAVFFMKLLQAQFSLPGMVVSKSFRKDERATHGLS